MAVNIEKMLEAIPEEHRPLARTFLAAMATQGVAEILAWIRAIIKGQWQAAYTVAVEAMTTDEKLAEMKRVNAVLLEKTTAAAEHRKAVKATLEKLAEAILTAGLTLVLK